jgi:hypothetical protein
VLSILDEEGAAMLNELGDELRFSASEMEAPVAEVIRYTGGWVDGWVDGWMGGWVDFRLIHSCDESREQVYGVSIVLISLCKSLMTVIPLILQNQIVLQSPVLNAISKSVTVFQSRYLTMLAVATTR